MRAAVRDEIEYGDLRLRCALAVQSLLEFRTLEMLGEHSRGIFRVRLEADTDPLENADCLRNTPVTLLRAGATGVVPLFSGYPEEIRLTDCGGYREAEITVLSGTAKLDRRKRSRVFQTPGQRYQDIIGRVLGDTPNAACVMTVPDRDAGAPFFQYGETDWEFLSRTCSRLGLPLVADARHHHPRCSVGLVQGSDRELPEGCTMSVSFDGDRFYGLAQKGVPVVREDFFCYHVFTGENLRLGDCVQVNGRCLSVNRKEMMLQDGEVAFRYCLAGESYALTAESQDADMTGLTLSGEVKGTEGERCELALDLEPEQSGGHQYPFAPETGNLMYCMPQQGTKVRLTLGSGEGGTALITGCIRENGAECPGTGEPSKRSFHTEHGKGMELYPDSMGLSGGGMGSLYLNDLSGTSLTSASLLVVYARGSVILDGGQLLDLKAVAGIFGQAGADESASCFCVNGRFDYLASGALLKGWRYTCHEAFEDAPKKGKFDWGGFWRNIAIGLAVVAVAVVAAAVIVGTGGGAAAVFAAGAAVGPQMAVGACVGAAMGAAATTVGMAIEDFNDGDVRSWQEAALSIGASAISGAITGALGMRFPHMNKFVAGAIDMVLSTAERGVVSWFTMDMTPQEWLAYTFDWRQMALDFGIGVGVDFLMDGVTDLFKGRNAARAVDGITDELSDALGDGAAREMRESMEDIIGDGAERTVRESAEEAAERGTRDITGELMGELDDYERFYDDLFDLQRESFGEYDDFLDDLRELQRGGIDGGNAGSIFESGGDTSFTWKLRGEDVTLSDVKVQNISYAKRSSTDLKTLRDEFNNTKREAFLKDLGTNAEYLRNAGFSEADILSIQNGKVPNGWQVHHKLPLDDGGTNSFDNLVLIQNEPYHKVITNYQNSVARQMSIGEVRRVQWPMPNGNIYPAQH